MYFSAFAGPIGDKSQVILKTEWHKSKTKNKQVNVYLLRHYILVYILDSAYAFKFHKLTFSDVNTTIQSTSENVNYDI